MRRLLAGVMKIGAGVAAGQLIVILVSPVLSRLFDPSEFGIYAIIVSVSAMLMVILSGRLDLAVATSANNRQAREAAMLGACYLTAGATAIAIVFLVIAVGSATGLVDTLAVEYFFIPVVVVFAGLFELSSAYLVRRGRYGQAAWRSLILNGSLAGSQVGLGAFSFPAGLTVGYLLSRVIGTVYSARVGGLSLARDVRGLRQTGLGVVVKRTAHFPLVVAPSSLLNTLGTQAPILLFGLLLGPAAAGLFGFAQRILSAPAALLGQSLAQVYTAETAFSLRNMQGNSRSLFLKTSLLLLIAGATVGLAVYFLSPLAFEPVFGDAWVEAGLIAQALSLGVGAQLIVVPLSQTMIVHGHHRAQFYWDASRFIVVVVVILGAFAAGADASGMAWAFSISSFAAYAALWCLCFRAVSLSGG